LWAACRAITASTPQFPLARRDSSPCRRACIRTVHPATGGLWYRFPITPAAVDIQSMAGAAIQPRRAPPPPPRPNHRPTVGPDHDPRKPSENRPGSGGGGEPIRTTRFERGGDRLLPSHAPLWPCTGENTGARPRWKRPWLNILCSPKVNSC